MNCRNGILIGLAAFMMASTSSALQVEQVGAAPTPVEISEGYYEIDYDNVELEVPEGTEVDPALLDQMRDMLGAGNIGIIINVGKIVWEVVKAGKPSNTWKKSHANAIPKAAENWDDLAGWKVPKKKNLKLKLKNKMGIQVVTFNFNVIFTYGGNFKGKGQYLRNVTVQPAHVKVYWGWNFEATVATADPVNVGSSKNPKAGMKVSTIWRASNPLLELAGQIPVFVQGDGSYTVL